MPRLQSAEVEGVLAWQFGVATEVEGLRWLQLQALKLGLYLGSVAIDALVFRPTELLHLDHGELLISDVVLPLLNGLSRLQRWDLILQPGLINAAVAPLLQTLGTVARKAKVGAGPLVGLKCLQCPSGFSAPWRS